MTRLLITSKKPNDLFKRWHQEHVTCELYKYRGNGHTRRPVRAQLFGKDRPIYVQQSKHRGAPRFYARDFGTRDKNGGNNRTVATVESCDTQISASNTTHIHCQIRHAPRRIQ